MTLGEEEGYVWRKNLKTLFDLSREYWGLPSQILMLVEELNELSVASLHLLRNLKNKEIALEYFAEEIADVEFMLEEMKYYFGNEEKIAYYRRKKEDRLSHILMITSTKRVRETTEK